MVIKHSSEIPSIMIEVEGTKGVSKQILIGEKDGAPLFTIRRFTVEPGGYTYYHTHDYEHEIYILKGTGIARSRLGETPISADSVLLVLPNEVHQILNSGHDDLIFLCMVPNRGEN
jgi:quercetin dioxygenase-like cupin family protein